MCNTILQINIMSHLIVLCNVDSSLHLSFKLVCKSSMDLLLQRWSSLQKSWSWVQYMIYSNVNNCNTIRRSKEWPAMAGLSTRLTSLLKQSSVSSLWNTAILWLNSVVSSDVGHYNYQVIRINNIQKEDIYKYFYLIIFKVNMLWFSSLFFNAVKIQNIYEILFCDLKNKSYKISG